jgi:hypothetical protein
MLDARCNSNRIVEEWVEFLIPNSEFRILKWVGGRIEYPVSRIEYPVNGSRTGDGTL